MSSSSSSAASIARRASSGNALTARLSRLARTRVRRSRMKFTDTDYAPSSRPPVVVCTLSHTHQAAALGSLLQKLPRVLAGGAIAITGTEHPHQLADHRVALQCGDRRARGNGRAVL